MAEINSAKQESSALSEWKIIVKKGKVFLYGTKLCALKGKPFLIRKAVRKPILINMASIKTNHTSKGIVFQNIFLVLFIIEASLF